MPAMGIRGTASKRAYNPVRGYKKPTLTSVGGAPGTITNNAAGYAVTVAGVNPYDSSYYPVRSKTTGKWYWECMYSGANQAFYGITDELTAQPTNAGYGSRGAGVHDSATVTWMNAGWFSRTLDPTWTGMGAALAIIGFALDLTSVTRTLKVYVNNVLRATLSWTGSGPPGAMYPYMCSYTDFQINFGRNGCTYTPPPGYFHL